MVTYKSATKRTVSIGRLQITSTGIDLEAADETLDQLVKEGFLVKEVTGVQEAAPVVEAPKEPEPPVVATKPK